MPLNPPPASPNLPAMERCRLSSQHAGHSSPGISCPSRTLACLFHARLLFCPFCFFSLLGYFTRTAMAWAQEPVSQEVMSPHVNSERRGIGFRKVMRPSIQAPTCSLPGCTDASYLNENTQKWHTNTGTGKRYQNKGYVCIFISTDTYFLHQHTWKAKTLTQHCLVRQDIWI